MVLELARPSEARCFPPAGDFFEAVLLQRPQATEAVEKGCFSRISEETESSEAVEKRCFSRISEATLGSFSAPFRGFFVLHCHGVWGWRIPCFGGLEGGSFELISSLICYRISEATLGSFSAPFLQNKLVLQRHGVFPRVGDFFKLFYCSSRRQQKLSKNAVFLGFQTRR